jgi:hypothetical protein
MITASRVQGAHSLRQKNRGAVPKNSPLPHFLGNAASVRAPDLRVALFARRRARESRRAHKRAGAIGLRHAVHLHGNPHDQIPRDCGKSARARPVDRSDCDHAPRSLAMAARADPRTKLHGGCRKPATAAVTPQLLVGARSRSSWRARRPRGAAPPARGRRRWLRRARSRCRAGSPRRARR